MKVGPDELSFFIFTAGSDLHIKYKLGKSLLRREGKDESEWLDTPVEWYRKANLKMFADAIGYARDQGVTMIEAGNAEDGSRAELDYIIELGKAAMDAGASRQAFPDTVGIASPESITHYIGGLLKAFPGVDIVLHFHNDFDMATINTITGMKLGANIPTVTLGGIGERAGNTPLHALLAALKVLYGITIPGIKYEKIHSATLLASRLSGIPIQPHEPIVGSNVYSHETGIHTAGMVVDPRIYQVIDADDYGGKKRYVFGKHSGTAIVEHVLRLNEDELGMQGVEISEELINRVLTEVKRLREQQAALHKNEKLVDTIYERMNQLGISEYELVELAKHLGKDSESKIETFW
jgi:isopropylmalate/homocitrate/citramalate synthase